MPGTPLLQAVSDDVSAEIYHQVETDGARTEQEVGPVSTFYVARRSG